MKKKLVGLLVAGVAVFSLSGCGSSGGDDYAPPPAPVTDFGFFIIEDSQSFDLYYVEDLEYNCGLGTQWTGSNGVFEYVIGDVCEFNFVDIYGDDYASIIVHDIDFDVDPVNGDYIVYDDDLFDDIDFFGSEILNFYR